MAATQSLLRKYELFIGNIPSLDVRIDTPNAVDVPTTKPDGDIRVVGEVESEDDDYIDPEVGRFIKIDNHHFTADIKYPREGSGKQTVTQMFKIYNTSPETDKRIKAGSLLILRAGYNTDSYLPIICATQIKKSSIRKEGDTRVTTILCSEAYNVKSRVKYAKTFPREFTYQQAIEDVLTKYAAYGVPTGRIEYTDAASTKQFSETYTIMGSINYSLDSLCKGCGLRWYIAGGEIFIQPKSKAKDDFVNILSVKPDNIKNTVEFLDDTTNKDSEQTSTRTNGVKLTVNLTGNINRADGIELVADPNASAEYNEFAGKYRIESVNHKLDYEGGSWDTTIEARG